MQPPKFCFSLWFLYQSKPVFEVTLSTYDLLVALLQFVLISTYHHCVCIMWFSVYLCICLTIPFDWPSTTSMWFCLLLTAWESIYFVISYYHRIGVGIFCKVCYSVWTRFIIHIIKATCLLYQKVPKLCTTGKTKFYSLQKNTYFYLNSVDLKAWWFFYVFQAVCSGNPLHIWGSTYPILTV